MSQDQWSAVDRYFGDLLLEPDADLENALKASDEAGLPQIAVSPMHGKLLYLLVLLQKAERILEIGTLGGYSTIWMAKALPRQGRLTSLEYDPRHADIAADNIEKAGLQARVDIKIGAALDLLPDIEKEIDQPFDFIFIDADKENNANYFSWALKLSAPGSVIIVDNVVRDGKILNQEDQSAQIQGVRAFNQRVAEEKRVQATAIQTIGFKGYDGFMLIRVDA